MPQIHVKSIRIQGLKPPTYTAFIPRKPTEKEYQSLMEEFWWKTIYVAKNLWRDELMHVKYNLDFVMKFQLLRKLLETSYLQSIRNLEQ